MPVRRYRNVCLENLSGGDMLKTVCAKPFRGLDGRGIYLRTPQRRRFRIHAIGPRKVLCAARPLIYPLTPLNILFKHTFLPLCKRGFGIITTITLVGEGCGINEFIR